MVSIIKLNDKIDEMYLLREQKRDLETQLKEVADKIAACNDALLIRLREVGTTTARGSLASATITESVVPNIKDWGAVSDWIMANDGVYLVHRRISAGPWRELMDSGEIVPGIEPYTKTSISLIKLRD